MAKTKLQIAREKIGLTQVQLAFKANMNLRTLQSYEIGNLSIDRASFTTIVKLCEILMCSPIEFLEEDENIRLFMNIFYMTYEGYERAMEKHKNKKTKK